jgi:hypothetical protein
VPEPAVPPHPARGDAVRDTTHDTRDPTRDM